MYLIKLVCIDNLKSLNMSTWFEIVLTVYGFIFLILLMKISGCCEFDEEKAHGAAGKPLTEEMRRKLYS